MITSVYDAIIEIIHTVILLNGYVIKEQLKNWI